MVAVGSEHGRATVTLDVEGDATVGQLRLRALEHFRLEALVGSTRLRLAVRRELPTAPSGELNEGLIDASTAAAALAELSCRSCIAAISEEMSMPCATERAIRFGMDTCPQKRKGGEVA